ncbi:MAG: M23 family metallopeptidase [Patescibacteria group bacterium]
MKKNLQILIILAVILVAGLGVFLFIKKTGPACSKNADCRNINIRQNVNINQNINTTRQNTNITQNVNATSNSNFQPPLTRAGERVTKKPFGIYITKDNSPVQPERFAGYHTGTDFEVFPEELNTEVPVHAVCSGTLKLKETASGYGGVAVQNCELNGAAITVIYGHLKLSSITKIAGENLTVGETLGILGDGYSAETNGERKHLHLGFHKGTATNIKGYVSLESQLSDWINPCLYVCHN